MANFTISLKAARINAELSQSEVAEKVGVSKDTITNWESGRTKISADGLMALAKVYNVPIDLFSLPTG